MNVSASSAGRVRIRNSICKVFVSDLDPLVLDSPMGLEKCNELNYIGLRHVKTEYSLRGSYEKRVDVCSTCIAFEQVAQFMTDG